MRWMLLSLILAAMTQAAMPARAMDMEPIAVRSAIGEPLLAEIPIKASPEELRSLRAELAPPVVFARVGLSRPRGAVADLRFSIRDTGGQPAIRITTVNPVSEEFFTFLIQLDWDAGRMIREFSIALREPTSMPATALPVIELPGVSEPPLSKPVELPSVELSFVEPPLEPPPLAAPIAVVATRPIAAPASPAAADPPAAPIPLQTRPSPAAAPPAVAAPPSLAASPTPTASPAPQPEAPPERTASATPSNPSQTNSPRTSLPAPAPRPVQPLPGGAQHGPVKSGETLTRIAARIDGAGAMHEQALAALLLANPEAFIDGNINRLMQGATLQLPAHATLASIDPGHARDLVRLQIREWQEGPGSVPPAEMAAALAAVRTGMQQAAETTPVSLAPPRLEIAPPERELSSEPDIKPDITGIGSAGATTLHREMLASRDAEIEYLKQRVTELEGSHDELQQVITLQDNALATAQERLTQAEGDGWISVRSSWLWSGLAGLLFLGGLAGLWLRRKRGRNASIETAAPRRSRWHRA